LLTRSAKLKRDCANAGGAVKKPLAEMQTAATRAAVCFHASDRDEIDTTFMGVFL
jgi:hypothetical protein